MITTKVTQYRIVHHFNQDGKLAVAHIYYAQCKVLFFWHTFGQAHTERTAMEQLFFHENATKDRSFFGRLYEVWATKISAAQLFNF